MSQRSPRDEDWSPWTWNGQQYERRLVDSRGATRTQYAERPPPSTAPRRYAEVQQFPSNPSYSGSEHYMYTRNQPAPSHPTWSAPNSTAPPIATPTVNRYYPQPSSQSYSQPSSQSYSQPSSQSYFQASPQSYVESSSQSHSQSPSQSHSQPSSQSYSQTSSQNYSPSSSQSYSQPSSQDYTQSSSKASAQFQYADFGSNSQNRDIYDADDTDSSATARPGPTVNSEPSEDNRNDKPQSEASYEPLHRSDAVDRSPPVVVSQQQRAGADEYSPRNTPRDTPRDTPRGDYNRGLPRGDYDRGLSRGDYSKSVARGDYDDTVAEFGDLRINKTSGSSKGLDSRSSLKPERESENARDQTQKGSKRAESKTSHARRPEERQASRYVSERPRQEVPANKDTGRDYASQTRKREPGVRSDATPPLSGKDRKRERRKSSAHPNREWKESEPSYPKTSRDFERPNEERREKAPYLDAQHRRASESRRQPDTLDPEYKIHTTKEFSVGKVLKTLWSEPLGDNSVITNEDVAIPALYGQAAYSSVRRFVIIANDEGHCLCVPVLTYSGQGTAKAGVKAEHHAIIYMDGTEPKLLPNERPLRKKPIKVAPRTVSDKLLETSRINYNKIYTVEHNLRVCFIGKVHKDSEADFYSAYNMTHSRRN